LPVSDATNFTKGGLYPAPYATIFLLPSAAIVFLFNPDAACGNIAPAIAPPESPMKLRLFILDSVGFAFLIWEFSMDAQERICEVLKARVPSTMPAEGVE
jgi:hypothetical protein